MSELDPAGFAPCRIVIASPPCQAFSMAGSGHGRAAADVYLDAIERWMKGEPPSREELDEQCEDERAHLVLEPLRWALALRPQVVACEQVEPVLPLWEKMGFALRTVGYRTWAGVVSCERYGVPQTRRRAILMCSLNSQPAEPPASHARYIPPRRKELQDEVLFAAPDPERIVAPEDRGLRPWVSMAQALGWGEHDQAGFPRRNDLDSNSEYRERDFRQATEPAFMSEAPAPTVVGTRKSEDGLLVGKQMAAGEGRNVGGRGWTEGRPATTVAGDPRVHPPGHKENSDDPPGRFEQRRGENAVRVSEQEASVLQGFPADYPWQGTRTARFRQIGDAFPPQAAHAVLSELMTDLSLNPVESVA